VEWSGAGSLNDRSRILLKPIFSSKRLFALFNLSTGITL
jgi:hypothetical protein